MLGVQDITVYDVQDIENYRKSLEILQNDKEAMELLEKFREEFKFNPDHAAVDIDFTILKALYSKSVYEEKALEIIWRKKQENKGSQGIDELEKKCAVISQSISMGTPIPFDTPVNMADLVNKALFFFEICYSIPPERTQPIRSFLVGRINSVIENTDALSFDEKKIVVQMGTDIVHLWREHRHAFSVRVNSDLTRYSPLHRIDIKIAMPFFFQAILVTRVIDRLKKEVTPEDVAVTLASAALPHAHREAISALFKDVFSKKSHFDDLFNQYILLCERHGKIRSPATLPVEPVVKHSEVERLPQVSVERPEVAATVEPAVESKPSYAEKVTQRMDLSEREADALYLYAQYEPLPAKFPRTGQIDIPLSQQPSKQSQQMSLRRSASSRHLANPPPVHDVVEEKAIKRPSEQRAQEPPPLLPRLTRSASTLHLGDARPVAAAAQQLAEDVSQAVEKKPGLFARFSQRLRSVPATLHDYIQSAFKKVEKVDEEDEEAASEASADEGEPNTASVRGRPATKKKRKKTNKPTAREIQAEKSDEPYSDEAYLAEQMEQVKIEKAKMPETSQQQPSTSIDLSKNRKIIPEFIKEGERFLYSKMGRGHVGKEISSTFLQASDLLNGVHSYLDNNSLPKMQRLDLRKFAVKISNSRKEYEEDIALAWESYYDQIEKLSLINDGEEFIKNSMFWENGLALLLQEFHPAALPQINKFMPQILPTPAYCRRIVSRFKALEKKYFLEYTRNDFNEQGPVGERIEYLQDRGTIITYLAGLHTLSIEKDAENFNGYLSKMRECGWKIKDEPSFLARFVPLAQLIARGEALIHQGNKFRLSLESGEVAMLEKEIVSTLVKAKQLLEEARPYATSMRGLLDTIQERSLNRLVKKMPIFINDYSDAIKDFLKVRSKEITDQIGSNRLEDVMMRHTSLMNMMGEIHNAKTQLSEFIPDLLECCKQLSIALDKLEEKYLVQYQKAMPSEEDTKDKHMQYLDARSVIFCHLIVINEYFLKDEAEISRNTQVPIDFIKNLKLMLNNGWRIEEENISFFFDNFVSEAALDMHYNVALKTAISMESKFPTQMLLLKVDATTCHLAFLHACDEKRVEMAELILDKTKTDPNWCPGLPYHTPLAYACGHRSREMVKMLLGRKETDPNVLSQERPALWYLFMQEPISNEADLSERREIAWLIVKDKRTRLDLPELLSMIEDPSIEACAHIRLREFMSEAFIRLRLDPAETRTIPTLQYKAAAYRDESGPSTSTTHSVSTVNELLKDMKIGGSTSYLPAFKAMGCGQETQKRPEESEKEEKKERPIKKAIRRL